MPTARLRNGSLKKRNNKKSGTPTKKKRRLQKIKLGVTKIIIGRPYLETNTILLKRDPSKPPSRLEVYPHPHATPPGPARPGPSCVSPHPHDIIVLSVSPSFNVWTFFSLSEFEFLDFSYRLEGLKLRRQ